MRGAALYLRRPRAGTRAAASLVLRHRGRRGHRHRDACPPILSRTRASGTRSIASPASVCRTNPSVARRAPKIRGASLGISGTQIRATSSLLLMVNIREVAWQALTGCFLRRCQNMCAALWSSCLIRASAIVRIALADFHQLSLQTSPHAALSAATTRSVSLGAFGTQTAAIFSLRLTVSGSRARVLRESVRRRRQRQCPRVQSIRAAYPCAWSCQAPTRSMGRSSDLPLAPALHRKDGHFSRANLPLQETT